MLQNIKKQKFAIISLVLCTILAISLLVCFPQSVRAEDKQLIEIIPDESMSTLNYPCGNTYNITLNEYGLVKINNIVTNYKSSFIYIMLQSSGGAGGQSYDGSKGYGGGSGSFGIYRLELTTNVHISVVAGAGGEYGKKDLYEFNKFFGFNYNDGDGAVSFVLGAWGTKTSGSILYGGQRGTTSTPGAGGEIYMAEPLDSTYITEIYTRDGLDGGVPSTVFSVTLSEPGYKSYTKLFNHYISGFAWSGIGGAASPFGKGADGGALNKSGQNAQFSGVGGGGAGKGSSIAGIGGNGEVRFFVGSN